MFGSDDDADFLAVNGSKLASLFHGAQAGEDSKATFTYAAPRQPKKGILKEVQPPTSISKAATSLTTTDVPKLSIIIVKAVHTFLLEDGKYNPQGKLGAALLGNSDVHLYQLLLYKGKQLHVTSTPITSDFQFTVQANNYSTFYTDQKQNWSLHFESDVDGEEFARQIGLARANSIVGCDGIRNLATQVLHVPVDNNDPPANVGDTIDVFYTVKTYLGGQLGKLVESNVDAQKAQRVKIRENVWEEGLIGAMKGSKRMIMLPPTFLGPWKAAVPEGTSLVVEVEPIRVRQAKISVLGRPAALPSMIDSESAPDSSTDDQSIKARGASISEALTNSPKTHKASIISRMARMGQATLPLKGAIACNPSDSEETGDESSVKSIPALQLKTSKNRTKPRSSLSHQPPSSTDSAAKPPQPVAVYQPMQATWQPQQQAYTTGQFPGRQFQSDAGDGQYYVGPRQMVPTSTAQMYASPSGSAITSPTSDISVFLAESRMHNTEVRMAVTKVADKVDLLLSKSDGSQTNRPNYSGALLDSSTLLASVQKIVSENESLQSELTDKRNKLECQNERIYQLLNTNHKYLEQNNSSTADLEATVSGLRQDNAKLLAEVDKANERASQLQSKDNAEALNLAALVKQQQAELDELKSSQTKRESLMAQLTGKLSEAVEANERHGNTISQQQQAMLEIQDRKDRLDAGLLELSNQFQNQRREAEEHTNLITVQHMSEIRQLQQQVEAVERRYAAMESQNDSEPANMNLVIAEVKRVMNAVWKSLNAKFDSGASYDGDEIRQTLMSTIRDVTIQFVDMKTTDARLGGIEQNLDDVERKVTEADMKSVKVEQKLEDVPNKTTAAQLTSTVDNLAGDQEQAVAPSVPDSRNDWQLDSTWSEQATSQTGDSMPAAQVELHGSSDQVSVEVKLEDSAQVELHGSSDQVSVEVKLEDAAPVQVKAAPESSKPNTVEENPGRQQEVLLPTQKEENRPALTEDIEGWRPQPPPPPLFDDDEDDDDWLA